eukprot:67405_1
MAPSLLFILLSLYIIDIANCNSCVIYNSERECNIQTRCLWDKTLTKCVCGSIIPQDVIIIMDSSGSVQAAGWEIQKNICTRFNIHRNTYFISDWYHSICKQCMDSLSAYRSTK